MKDVRNIPDRFKYPLPREHSNKQRPQQNANIRNQVFDRRKLDHDRKYKDTRFQAYLARSLLSFASVPGNHRQSHFVFHSYSCLERCNIEAETVQESKSKTW